jgi:hypothetical protein
MASSKAGSRRSSRALPRADKLCTCGAAGKLLQPRMRLLRLRHTGLHASISARASRSICRQ